MRRTHPATAVRHVTLAAIALLALAGCSRVGLPMGAAEIASGAAATPVPAAQATPAAALALASGTDGVEPSDWEAIRRTVERTLSGTSVGTAVPWSNPLTGSSGTVTALSDGPDCRAYTASLSDMRGVRRYQAEACKQDDATWRFTSIVPEDSQLL